MAVDYAGAVKEGTGAATRLHQTLGSQERLKVRGGSIDVFSAILHFNLPLLLRPLKGLLGAYLLEPIPGVLVTTERPLSIQRFTAAHELGHFFLKHDPSLDDESLLRRMANVASNSEFNADLQEVEADAFAVSFLMPRWLVQWHCERQGWKVGDLQDPKTVYQLSLRLGTSYEATSWTLERYRLISMKTSRDLRAVAPRKIKSEILRDHRPSNYRGDVWVLTERDANTRIDGSRNDHFVLRLNEHSGGGYLWNIEQLRKSGFAIIEDARDIIDNEGIGSPVVRQITAALDSESLDSGCRGTVSLHERRPWQKNDEALTTLDLDFDLTGPEQEGLSRVERRSLLEAA